MTSIGECIVISCPVIPFSGNHPLGCGCGCYQTHSASRLLRRVPVQFTPRKLGQRVMQCLLNAGTVLVFTRYRWCYPFDCWLVHQAVCSPYLRSFMLHHPLPHTVSHGRRGQALHHRTVHVIQHTKAVIAHSRDPIELRDTVIINQELEQAARVRGSSGCWCCWAGSMA